MSILLLDTPIPEEERPLMIAGDDLVEEPVKDALKVQRTEYQRQEVVAECQEFDGDCDRVFDGLEEEEEEEAKVGPRDVEHKGDEVIEKRKAREEEERERKR